MISRNLFSIEFRTGLSRRILLNQTSTADRSAAEKFRKICRQNLPEATTTPCPSKHVQTNVTFLPRDWALDFLLFCLRNPQSCPLIEVTDPGNKHPTVAPLADLTTDLPSYRIYKDGRHTKTVSDISEYWTQDIVAFLIGCSFTFDEELKNLGLAPRHDALKAKIPIYKTNMTLNPAGKFQGTLMVSMRPYRKEQIEKVSNVSAAYPGCHGAPIHIGDPQEIGIDVDRHRDGNIGKPDLGDHIHLEDGDVPMFWCCAVSGLSAVENARVPFAIRHGDASAGFVTDLFSEEIKAVN